jgi:hypothetical protein
MEALELEREFFGHILPRYTRRVYTATPTMAPVVFRALREKRAAAEAELTAAKLAAQHERAQNGGASPMDTDAGTCTPRSHRVSGVLQVPTPTTTH